MVSASLYIIIQRGGRKFPTEERTKTSKKRKKINDREVGGSTLIYLQAPRAGKIQKDYLLIYYNLIVLFATCFPVKQRKRKKQQTR